MTGRDICAVVPVKEAADAKQRLAAFVPTRLRAGLVLTMLEDVLNALRSARGLAAIVVVTIDPAAAALARRLGAHVLSEHARGGHTPVVAAAARTLVANGRGGMLQVPGDIPLISSAEVERLIELHRPAPSFTISPSHDDRGSNAVLVSPPDVVPLTFGDDSFYPHLSAARRCGIEPTVVRLPGIARDLDLPEDLQAFRELRSDTRTQAFLSTHDLGDRDEVRVVATAAL